MFVIDHNVVDESPNVLYSFMSYNLTQDSKVNEIDRSV